MKHLSPSTVVSTRAYLRLIALCAATSTRLLFAANGTWDGSGANANWTTLSNWTGDAAFPGATSGETNADTATFNAAVANTWGAPGTPILIDSAFFNIKNITFDTAAVGSFTIGTTNGNALHLTNGGAIRMNANVGDTAVQTINAPIVIVGENGTYTFDNARDKNTTKLIFNGAITAGSSGAATVNFSSKQSSSPNEVNGVISDGAADRLALNHNTGTWYYTANNTYTGDTTINGGSARFTGNNSGGGDFTINSGGTAYFTGTNSYAGTFTLSGGSSTANLYLGSDIVATGSILGVTQIDVTSSRLFLVNTFGNADRLNDSVAINLSGVNSIFQLQGNATTDTSETIGALTLGSGSSSIDLISPTGRITTLNAASLTRASGFGTAVINSRTLGIGSSQTGRLFLSTAPSGINLVGSGGAPAALNTGVKNLAIVPWLYGSDNGVGRFITYDTVTGLRYFGANETQSSIASAVAPSLGGTGDNVLLTTSETGITTKVINSLMLSPGAAQAVTGAGAGNSLVISSGALALTGAQTATVSGFDSIIFGNSEGVITAGHPNAVIQFDSAIDVTGNGGITKAGAGTLILNAANTYSGATTINQATLQIGNGGTTGDLGTSSKINLRSGATLRVNRTGNLAIGSVDGGGSIIVDKTGSLTLNQSGSANVINSISGVSGSTIVFDGSESAQTTINTALSSAGQLVKFDGGTVNLAITRPIVSNLEINGGVVNAVDNQTSFLSAIGPQSFTLNSGEFNVMGTYGLSGFNTTNNANTAGSTNAFTGLQTGGLLLISDRAAGTQARFSLGNSTAGSISTYTLSGGIFNANGHGSFMIGASADGNGSATFNLAGGKLLVAGNNNNPPTYILGAQGNGAKQAFVWTGGVLATIGYDATNLTSTAGTAVSSSTNTLTNAGGILAPGDIGVTGRTTIVGNYAVTSPNAALHIDIAGSSSSGSFQDASGAGKYDNLNISGIRTVTLGGKLHVNLLDGFDGNGTFSILNAGSSIITGTFNNTVVDAYGNGQRVVLDNGVSSYLVTYGTTTVSLGSFVTDNVWTGFNGTDWSDATWWSAFSPQSAGQIAQFTTEASGGSVNLDTNRTIGGIIFDNASDHYAISSNNGSSLTLDNTGVSGPADSAITVTSGSHSVAVPLTLAHNLNVETTGTSSAITLNGTVSGSGKSLTKTGSGSLSLLSANTYSGGTSVTSGTLFANNSTGSATGSGPLTISYGATLAGSGFIGSATTIAGHVTPGATADSVAILTFDSSVNFQIGSTIHIDINGAGARGVTHDGIDFNSSLTISGAALTFSFGSAIADDTNLYIFTGAPLTSTFANVTASGFGNYNGLLVLNDSQTAYTAIFGAQTVSFNLADGTLSFAASTLIPEPATFTALLGALALATGALRRRSRI